MLFFPWWLFSFIMFPRLIHADVCTVHSSEICIVFHCVTMPQLIRPFFCPRAFGFFQVFFFLCSFGNSAENILDIYVSWSLSIWLSMEYIPWSGVIGSNCFSEWLDPFMFHSLEFLLHSIPSLRCGGVLPLSSSIPNLGYLCWWPWGHSHLSQPDPMMFLKPQWTCEMFLCIPMLLAEHKRGNDRLEIDWVYVTIRVPGSFWRMKATG